MTEKIKNIFCSYILEEQVIIERSYDEKDIPKNFYLALHFILGDDRSDKLIEDLKFGKLDGVRGIGGTNTKEMIKDWGTMREVMLIMPSEEVLKINKLSRVMYNNPEYLLSDGMKALRRLFAETSDKYSSIFTKMEKYIFSCMDDPKIKGWIDYNGPLRNLDYKMDIIKSIHNTRDLTKHILQVMPENIQKEKSFDWWHKAVSCGVTKMGELYSNEKEWLVKGDAFHIPKNSKLIFVESSYYKKEWEKSRNENKSIQFFAVKSAVENYEKFLRLVEEIKKHYKDVYVIPEDWVSEYRQKLFKQSTESK